MRLVNYSNQNTPVNFLTGVLFLYFVLIIKLLLFKSIYKLPLHK